VRFFAAILTLLLSAAPALAASPGSPHVKTFTVDVWPTIPGSAIGNKSGTSNTIATVLGTLTTSDCIDIGSVGDLVDAGGKCATTNGGLANQLAYFSVNGNLISSLPLGLGVLTILQNDVNSTNGIAQLPITAADLNTGAVVANLGFTPLSRSNNLSDVPNIPLARSNLGAAGSGINSDITSLAGLTTPLQITEGGTGTATPSLVAGNHVTITGSFPNQKVAMTPGTVGINPGGSVGQIQYNLDGTDLGGFSLAGDCTLTVPNIVCTETNGIPFGNMATSAASPTSLTALAGATNSSGGLVTDPVANSVLATMAPHTVKSNATGISGVPTDSTLSAIIDDAVGNTTVGNILFRGSSGWSSLTPGTAGQFLETHGAGSATTWASSGTPFTIPAGTVLGNFGTSTAAATAVPPPVGFRNRIINGDFSVAQYKIGLGSLLPASSFYATDRWFIGASSSGIFSANLGADTGGAYSNGLTLSSFATTPAASAFFGQRIAAANS
jgi:hypothetical protein